LTHPSDIKYTKDLEKRQKSAKKRDCFVNPLLFQARISRISSSTFRTIQNAILIVKSMAWIMDSIEARLIVGSKKIVEH